MISVFCFLFLLGFFSFVRKSKKINFIDSALSLGLTTILYFATIEIFDLGRNDYFIDGLCIVINAILKTKLIKVIPFFITNLDSTYVIFLFISFTLSVFNLLDNFNYDYKLCNDLLVCYVNNLKEFIFKAKITFLKFIRLFKYAVINKKSYTIISINCVYNC